MKAINKILWAIVSAAICVVYKFEAKASCKYAIVSSVRVGTTCTDYVCSAATICKDYPKSKYGISYSDCAGAWQKETYIDNKTNFQGLGPLTSVQTSDILLCDQGLYVEYCKAADGTLYYTGMESYFASGKCVSVGCSTCPGLGTTGDSSAKLEYDARGYMHWDSDFVFVCSNENALTEAALDACYMQIVALSCIAETIYDLNSINDCFIPAGTQLGDTPGSYYCTDETGTYESAWY